MAEPARSHRLLGLGLVLLVGFASRLELVLERLFGEPLIPVRGDATLSALGEIAQSLSLLFLLAYVLFRQGRSLRQLGVTARRSDLAFGLALAVLRLLPHAIDDLANEGALGTWLVSKASLDQATLVELGSMLCAVASRELVLCAYVVTEVLAFSASAGLAVAASVCLAVVYDSEYRWPTVVSLLLGALFYWKTRRATPLVVGGVADGLWVLLHSAGS